MPTETRDNHHLEYPSGESTLKCSLSWFNPIKCPLGCPSQIPPLLDPNSKVQLAFSVIGQHKKRSVESFQEKHAGEVTLQWVESGEVPFRVPTTV